MGVATSVYQQQSTGVNIQLDNQKHLYVPGETVSGTVFFDQLRHGSEVISIDLIGEVGYTMTDFGINGAASTTHYCFPFFTVSKTSIMDEEKFELCLDQHLPPSVNLTKGVYPYIRYLLQVNLSKTDKHRCWIIVCPRTVIPRSSIHPVYFDVFNRKEMHLVGSLDLEWVLPGDKFQIEYQIKNPNHAPIKYMDGSIIMRAKFIRGEYREKVMDIIIDDVRHTTEEETTGLIPLVFPFGYFPPTCNYTNDTETFHVDIEYWIILEVHLKGTIHHFKTSLPLIVGYEPDNIAFNEVSLANRQRLAAACLRIARAYRRHHT